MPTPIPADEPAVLKKETAYKIHPREMGDEAVVERITAIRQKVISYDERILDAQASVSCRSYRKLFLSEHWDLDQTVMWTAANVMAMAARGQEIKMGCHPFSVLGGAEVLDEMDGGVEKCAAMPWSYWTASLSRRGSTSVSAVRKLPA